MRKFSWLSVIFFIAACQVNGDDVLLKNEQPQVDTKSNHLNEDVQWREGVVVYNSFEGGFYGIVDHKGNKLLPLNLNNKFKKADMPIRFTGAVDKSVMTIQQWGTAFKLEKIEAISDVDMPSSLN